MERSISNSVFETVLSQGNKEQNQHYPPGVFTSHYQLASDWLKDELAKLYPTDNSIEDMLRPYMITKMIMVRNGKMPMPNVQYRNFLGIAFFVQDMESCKPIPKNEFQFSDPSAPTPDEIERINAELQADAKMIRKVSQGEWEYFTMHPYKKPKSPKKAKGCIFDDNTMSILPLDIPYVQLRFVRKTEPFYYGYKMLPDDTFVFNPDTTVEELWNENAIQPLVKAVNILFANYVRDTEYIASAKDLRDNSLF